MKKKVLLISPGNFNRLPFINYYRQLLKNEVGLIDIINWDRNLSEEPRSFTFVDKKRTIRKNMVDYLKYSSFCKNKIALNKYDLIVVFSIQLIFLLGRYLMKYYEGKYIVDIRDLHFLCHTHSVKVFLRNANAVIISSRGFKSELPKNINYIINHNLKDYVLNAEDDRKFSLKLRKEMINSVNLSYIGSIRDYKTNIRLITGLKNSHLVNLHYHGESQDAEKIKSFVDKWKISNVYLTGEYFISQEPELYLSSDFINICLPQNEINSSLLLPNRLYKAVLYYRPVITTCNTFLSSVVRDFDLGLVVENFCDIEVKIRNYLALFNFEKFIIGRNKFLEVVQKENEIFLKCILGNLNT